jgi:hypothetical protein
MPAIRSGKLALGVGLGFGAAAIVVRRLNGEHQPGIEEFAIPHSPVHEVGRARILLPIAFHRSESFQGVFTADLEAVRRILPGESLQPVRVAAGRAAFAVSSVRYLEATYQDANGGTRAVVPYGEVFIGPLVTEEPAPPVIPLFTNNPPVGIFVLHLPVTTREARDVGRVLWGMAKFVADMAFEDAIHRQSVSLSEGDKSIMELTVRAGGRREVSRTQFVSYSVLRGQLIRTVVPVLAHRQWQLGSHGSLSLGDHPVADELRRLELSPAPFLTETVVQQRLVMPIGTAIGSAAALRLCR